MVDFNHFYAYDDYFYGMLKPCIPKVERSISVRLKIWEFCILYN